MALCFYKINEFFFFKKLSMAGVPYFFVIPFKEFVMALSPQVEIWKDTLKRRWHLNRSPRSHTYGYDRHKAIMKYGRWYYEVNFNQMRLLHTLKKIQTIDKGYQGFPWEMYKEKNKIRQLNLFVRLWGIAGHSRMVQRNIITFFCWWVSGRFLGAIFTSI